MIDIDALKRDKRPQSAWVVHALIDRLEAAEKERDDLRESEKWYRRRCDLLQEQQSKMRDPERTIVCDILSNGALLHADFAGDRYAIPDDVMRDAKRYRFLRAAKNIPISTEAARDPIVYDAAIDAAMLAAAQEAKP